jgi:threonine synthase
MPRVVRLVDIYRSLAGEQAVQVIDVSEQEIMDAMLMANRNGHITCTQGGECLAGIRKAVATGKTAPNRMAILDATAHALKFAIFQEKYFSDSFQPEFEVTPKPELQNSPHLVNIPAGVPRPDMKKLNEEEFDTFVRFTAGAVAEHLGLSVDTGDTSLV